MGRRCGQNSKFSCFCAQLKICVLNSEYICSKLEQPWFRECRSSSLHAEIRGSWEGEHAHWKVGPQVENWASSQRYLSPWLLRVLDGRPYFFTPSLNKRRTVVARLYYCWHSVSIWPVDCKHLYYTCINDQGRERLEQETPVHKLSPVDLIWGRFFCCWNRYKVISLFCIAHLFCVY